MNLSPDMERTIDLVARQTGIDRNLLRAFVQIESGGRPDVTTGSYKGALQLSDQEFRKHGGRGNIYDPVENLRAGAAKLLAESSDFEKRYGRKPTPPELYLVHQQGFGGYAAHAARPELPAWKNMASTGEGRQRGERWAQKAIWGNIPDKEKARFGSVDNVTSRDFMNFWTGRVNRLTGAAPVEQGGRVVPAEQGERVAPAALAAEMRTTGGAPAAPSKDETGSDGMSGLAAAIGGLGSALFVPAAKAKTQVDEAPLRVNFRQYAPQVAVLGVRPVATPIIKARA